MQSKSSKIILGVVIVAIAFVVGCLVGKLVFGDNNQPTTTNSASSQSEPAKTDDLTSVLAHPTNYADKQITVKGSVYKVGSDYYLVEPAKAASKQPSKTAPSSIRLDLSKSQVDLSKYANIGSTTENNQPPKPAALKPAVTVSGTFKVSDQQLVLTVSSVKS